LITIIGFTSIPAATQVLDQRSIPKTIEGTTATELAWVSSSAILSPDGSINYEYIQNATQIQQRIESASMDPQSVNKGLAFVSDEDCQQVSRLYREQPMESTVESWIKNANVILTGEVVAIDQGFASGIPGTLARVKVEADIRIPPGFGQDGTAFFYIPFARFSLSGAAFCQGDSDLGNQVTVGSQVLVITPKLPMNLNGNMVLTAPWEITVEDSETGNAVQNSQLGQIFIGRPDYAAHVSHLRFWGNEMPQFKTLVRQVADVAAGIRPDVDAKSSDGVKR
jgi:hypothetical protein